MTAADYDALLFLSFGGPEKMEDVRPFLENVTRGRGIPPERLDEVGEHYKNFDGHSPLNDLNREIIDHVRTVLADEEIDMPIYFGNRNWHPMIEDTVEEMVNDGVRSALVFATSAWAGYSGCRQYHEDIARAREHLKNKGLPQLHLQRIRGFHDHPLFIDEFAKNVQQAFDRLPQDRRDIARLIFTAHSVPESADKAAGPIAGEGHLYSRQVAEASRLIADKLGIDDYDVVWQSRSGPPHIPWLEPDIVDHVEDLTENRGLKAAVVCPVGFVSDHIEVAWDLDSELQDEMERHDIVIERAGTPGPTFGFARMIVELIREQTEHAPVRRLGALPQFGQASDGNTCNENCCVQLKRRPHGAGHGAGHGPSHGAGHGASHSPTAS